MEKTVLKYTEKHHILEVDGTEYEIPQRTPKIVELIKKHDENLGDMTEYEGNISLLEIYFGKKNANKMFPDKDNTNLDKLSECARLATALFMADYARIQSENIKEKIQSVEPLLHTMGKASDIISTANTKNFVSKKKK